MKKILRLVLAILIIWIILFVVFPRLGKALKVFGDSIDFKAPSFNFINNVKSGATNLAKEGIDNIHEEYIDEYKGTLAELENLINKL